MLANPKLNNSLNMFEGMPIENRFEGKSELYSLHRPDYPVDLIPVLELETGLGKESVIADIGSGTGKLSKIFLDNGNIVNCVEPNEEMRERSKKDLSSYAKARFIEGTAEDTGLPDKSMNFIVVGQAFHWFDLEPTKKEFKRILKDGGSVILVWNERVPRKTGINAAYEKICKKYSKGYHKTGGGTLPSDFDQKFFKPEVRTFTLPNPQEMDLEGLMGRYFSASYSLKKGERGYGVMLKQLKKAFEENKRGDVIVMEQQTRVYIGRL